jgi:UDP-N-acetylmuramoyl-tripeptide--D-alanyl-D-alanine ligase
VPLTILKIKQDAQMAVIEMGANHQKEIESYCTIAQPTHGLITNCGKAHLEGFGGEEGVRKGKGELFDFLRFHNGAVFIYADYSYLNEMSNGIKYIHKYGTTEGEVTGEAFRSDPFLEVHFSKGFSGPISTQLVGSYNLPNVLAAVTIGKYFNVDEQKIKSALENYTPTNSRSQLIKKGSNSIILDAYNANPSSMRLAIENFTKTPNSNKILVLGAMAELGLESLHEHKEIISEIQKHNWKEVLLVGGDFLKIQHPFHSFTNAQEAGEWLGTHSINNSYLLIKGSRSTGMEKVMEYL